MNSFDSESTLHEPFDEQYEGLWRGRNNNTLLAI